MCRSCHCFLIILGLALLAHGAEDAPHELPPPAKRPIDFARDIQPILAQSCYECHGAERQESNYRLDTRDTALGIADFGDPPIVRGDSAASPLIQFVARVAPDEIVMPPDGEGTPLTNEQVSLLRAWIDQGVKWPEELAGPAETSLTTDHWSFQPLRQPPLPAINDDWIINPVDAFVLARLQGSGLPPSPPSDRRQLIRRLYLVMLGLPPAAEEIERFITDDLPAAYERLVDRVLNDPHYGERWGRHWLDVVRFGESDGFETNHERPNAFPYRDYVIAALNEDKPYDRFVFEQIAGDAAGQDAATGFLVGGAYDIVKSPDINLTLAQRQDELADMVNTTGTAFLGLTVGCARCHSHKFDPIPQKDFYSMQAVFAGVQHGERELRTPANEPARKTIEALRDTLAEREQELAALRELAKVHSTEPPDLRPPVQVKVNVEQFPPTEARFVRFSIHATNNGSEPCIDELEVYAAREEPAREGNEASAENFVDAAVTTRDAVITASGTLPGFEIHKLEHINDGRYGNSFSWISDTPGSGWVQIELAEPVLIERVVWGRDREELYRDRLAVDYTVEVATELGRWRTVANSEDRQPYDGQDPPDGFIARLPAGEAQRARGVFDATVRLRQRIDELTRSHAQVYAGRFAQPGTTHRLYRGDPMAKREPVAPDALSVTGSLQLPLDAEEERRRIALGNWIASADNPLTARVAANRLWHYHFGTGIVSTPSDFGAMGTPPSHPELLDWLATELIRSGWSLKHIHRLILCSNTFRQASAPREVGLTADAGCRLLWRFPPRRLEAEAIRDCVLWAAGTLNEAGGGRGFMLFDVNKETVHHYFPKETLTPAEWRRMVYMTKIRQEQDAVFGAFDCPDGGQVIPQRSRSTTPLQALNLLNSDFAMEQAEFFARRLQREAGAAPEDQVQRAFVVVYGRPARAAELTDSVAFVRKFGLPAMCRALLNSNEFLFIY